MPPNGQSLLQRLRLGLRIEPESPEKVFCIGMQRTGTTSIGDFCQTQLGLPRRGYPVSRARGWTRSWYEGRIDRVFGDSVFRGGVVFDDDPWWCPGVYELLAGKFPHAKFVMFHRDADAWFESLMAHSNGRSPGETDIHARIYGREAEYAHMLQAPHLRVPRTNGFLLAPEREHYIRVYSKHVESVMRFFERAGSDRFFWARLDDRDKFRRLAIFLGFEDRDYKEVHSNASSPAPEAPRRTSGVERDSMPRPRD